MDHQSTQDREGTTPPGTSPELVEKSHEIRFDQSSLKYTTVSGLLPVEGEKGALSARMFFTAYTLNQGDKSKNRPVTFVFNGGPGSSSVWLHMGGLAPRRVARLEDGRMPGQPFQIVDNEFTWLQTTDLVFIDPVGTGLSRASNDETEAYAKGIEGDVAYNAEFIRVFLSEFGRWSSPLFLCGESYGTFRVARMAEYLIDRGIPINGTILISSVLNMQTVRFVAGNDLPYILTFPSIAATAWFHNRVSEEDKNKDLRTYLDEVEKWVECEYATALLLGDRLPQEQREAILDGLERYSGLRRSWIEHANLRIHTDHFTKEMLRDNGKILGRQDARLTGQDSRSGVADMSGYDPSLDGNHPALTMVINDYLRQELGIITTDKYVTMSYFSDDWIWGSANDGYPDATEALGAAFAKNSHMHLFVASGYYDLATPYYATIFSLNHIGLAPSAWERIKLEEYPAGHMVYMPLESLKQLQADIVPFIEIASKPVQAGS